MGWLEKVERERREKKRKKIMINKIKIKWNKTIIAIIVIIIK